MKNILELIEATAERRGDAVALAEEGSALTFAELLTGARAGGSLLLRRGLGREPVVVFMRKSPAMVRAFLAAICAGCCYVPIEDSMPAHRIKMIIEKLAPRAVIYDERTAEKAAEYCAAETLISAAELFSGGIDKAALSAVRARQIDSDPIYIVFTSGSTGKPKGVTGCHRAVLDYAEAITGVIRPDERSVFGMQVPLYVDACLKELLSCFKCGSTVWLMPQTLFASPVRTVEYMNAHGVNTVCWVASALTLVSGLGAFDEVKPEHLSTVCFGSEVFPIKQLNLWREACPTARFINLYGPTECTGMSFYYELDRDFAPGEPIPVGRPFDNTGFMLLLPDDTEAAPGETGEICIRGVSLALGYYDDAERTAAAFCQNPLNDKWPERIYRTGDLGYLNERGELVFVSRKDYQIKHMGHRIELGEIEACADALEGVAGACCLWDRVREKLTLFYMGEAGERDVLRALKSALPRYMAPGRAIHKDILPLLPNGKLDRAAMEAEYIKSIEDGVKSNG